MGDVMLTLLKDLIRLPGLSGHERPAQERIQAAWEPLVDELSLSPIGSLHALKRGSGAAPRPSVLVATHMDAIGMMVSMLDHGLLRVAEIGGLEPRVLPGQPVTVLGRRDLPGLLVQPPALALPAEDRKGPVAVKYLMVDIGCRRARSRGWSAPATWSPSPKSPSNRGRTGWSGTRWTTGPRSRRSRPACLSCSSAPTCGICGRWRLPRKRRPWEER